MGYHRTYIYFFFNQNWVTRGSRKAEKEKHTHLNLGDTHTLSFSLSIIYIYIRIYEHTHAYVWPKVNKCPPKEVMGHGGRLSSDESWTLIWKQDPKKSTFPVGKVPRLKKTHFLDPNRRKERGRLPVKGPGDETTDLDTGPDCEGTWCTRGRRGQVNLESVQNMDPRDV